MVREMIPSTLTIPGIDNHTEKVSAASAAVPAWKPMTATKSASVSPVMCPHQGLLAAYMGPERVVKVSAGVLGLLQ